MDTHSGLLSEEVILALESLAEAFQARNIRHALIGGLATSMRGRLRVTQDLDFLVDVTQVALPSLLDDLIARGFTLDPPTVIKEYVREHMTAFTFRTVPIDWLKPVLPFYSRVLVEASPMEWAQGHTVCVATAEGLIMTKMVAFRPQDQIDIETLLTANRDTIDLDLIREESGAFRGNRAGTDRLA